MPHTIPELREAYLESAGYDVENNVAHARTFIATVRRLLLLVPKTGQTGGAGGELFEFDTRLLSEQLQRAELWLAAKAGGGVKFFDLSDFRE